jgi:SAM-dependent methyltransferase
MGYSVVSQEEEGSMGMAENDLHEENRRGWDAVSAQWQQRIDGHIDWRRCPADPGIALVEEELPYLQDVSDQEVCVLGSGDNLVVFTLAGMGAQVTSVDISQTQLDIAAGRARELGLDIEFVRSDVTELSGLADGTFDLVYTGGHVAAWVSDLDRYYAEAGRILRPGGRIVVNEYHPFRRLWKASVPTLELEVPYFERGPFEYDRSEEVDDWGGGPLPSHEYHWTVGDFASALFKGGFELTALHEFGYRVYEDWESPALAQLPGYLLLVAKKRIN